MAFIFNLLQYANETFEFSSKQYHTFIQLLYNATELF